MTPEQQQEATMRQMALSLADKRCKDGATVEEVITEAERVLKFLRAGMVVAS